MSGGEVRTESSTGGQKGVKLARHDLIPAAPIHELAILFGVGAMKYADDNWRNGYELSKSIGALKRHLELWVSGQERDEETGVSHLASVMWHCCCLYVLVREIEAGNLPAEFDNRHEVDLDEITGLVMSTSTILAENGGAS